MNTNDNKPVFIGTMDDYNNSKKHGSPITRRGSTFELEVLNFFQTNSLVSQGDTLKELLNNAKLLDYDTGDEIPLLAHSRAFSLIAKLYDEAVDAEERGERV